MENLKIIFFYLNNVKYYDFKNEEYKNLEIII